VQATGLHRAAVWLRALHACRNNPKYPAGCADTAANRPPATPRLPLAKFATLACNLAESTRNGFHFTRNPATCARNRSTPARGRKTPKREAESLGPRRSSTANVRVKPLPATEKRSRPTRKASRAVSRTLSLRGREGWMQRSQGWTESTKPCVQPLGRCAQGLEGSGLEVLGLRASLGTSVAESAAGTRGAHGMVPDTSSPPRYLPGGGTCLGGSKVTGHSYLPPSARPAVSPPCFFSPSFFARARSSSESIRTSGSAVSWFGAKRSLSM